MINDWTNSQRWSVWGTWGSEEEEDEEGGVCLAEVRYGVLQPRVMGWSGR